MAVTVEIKLDATPEEYDAAHDKLDVESNWPDGLIAHTGAEVDGGIRIIDVWESAGAFGKFAEARIGPAVAEVMGDNAPEITPTITELRRVITP